MSGCIEPFSLALAECYLIKFKLVIIEYIIVCASIPGISEGACGLANFDIGAFFSLSDLTCTYISLFISYMGILTIRQVMPNRTLILS